MIQDVVVNKKVDTKVEQQLIQKYERKDYKTG